MPGSDDAGPYQMGKLRHVKISLPKASLGSLPPGLLRFPQLFYSKGSPDDLEPSVLVDEKMKKRTMKNIQLSDEKRTQGLPWAEGLASRRLTADFPEPQVCLVHRGDGGLRFMCCEGLGGGWALASQGQAYLSGLIWAQALECHPECNDLYG